VRLSESVSDGFFFRIKTRERSTSEFVVCETSKRMLVGVSLIIVICIWLSFILCLLLWLLFGLLVTLFKQSQTVLVLGE